MEKEAFINSGIREGENIVGHAVAELYKDDLDKEPKFQKMLDLNLTLSPIMVVHLSIKPVNINPKQGGSQ